MLIKTKFPILKVTLLLLAIEFQETVARANNASKQKLLIETNSIQRTNVELDNVGGNSSRALKRVFLSNRNIKCNDGSQAGFYLRKSAGSRKWVVFLEGGWHCYDQKSCRTRWLKLRHLMTSASWPEVRDIGGILSSNPMENPYWHDANHVFVPYCSSDSWSGTKMKPESRDGLRFMGSLIVKQVIADLIPLGLDNSDDLLLAGSSAGGLGVMLNLDKVQTFLVEEKGLNVNVRGVSDSGWFLDREPYTPGAISASETVKKGLKIWDPELPAACVADHHQAEPWRCFFGHRLYNTLKSPLFVFQWLFDEAQMRADSVGAPVTPQQWDYIHDMGGALRASLANVTAVFAPSCIGHSVLTKRDWLDIKIEDISLAEALRCWDQSITNGRPNQRHADHKERKNRRRKHNNGKNKKEHLKPDGRRKLTKEQREQRRKERQKNKHENGVKSTKVPRLHRTSNGLETKTGDAKQTVPRLVGRHRNPNHRKRNKNSNNNNNNSNSNNNNKNADDAAARQNIRHQNNSNNKNKKRLNHPHHNRHKLNSQSNSLFQILEPKKCSLRLLEKCSWPQCNHSCPSLTNPLTGEEMKFLELLASFGLDMEAVATALGVDMQTLNNMDHTELVNLLTQQVS